MQRNCDKTFSKAFALASVVTSFERTQKLDWPKADRMPGTKWQALATQLTRRIVGRDILGRPPKRKKPVTGSISHKRSGDVPSAA